MSEREYGFRGVEAGKPRRAGARWGVFELSFDPDLGAIYSDGSDWVVMSGDSLRRIYDDILDILGDEDAARLWRSIGRHLGEKIHMVFEEREETGHAFEHLAAPLEQFGWGNLEVHESEIGDKIRVTVAGSVFTRGVERFTCPTCDMLGGVFEGYFERELGVEPALHRDRL